MDVKGENMKWGNNIENLNLISEKSKTKKNGVYSFRGITYKVEDGRCFVYAVDGKIFQSFGNFVVVIGKYGRGDNLKKILLNIKL